MVKVSIKKNVKPKKTTTKKTVKPKKKVMKEKEKNQAQSQSVVVNINDTITKKKRGTTKRSTIEKKPVQQIAPVIQSYNQPVFNKPAPQSTFASILASQEKPNIIAKELKDQSTITQALIEQNTQTEEPKVNELERVRKERIKKLDKVDVELKPIEEAYKIKSYESSQGINKALRSQLFDEKGDDTEEINQLILESRTGGLFRPAINIPNPLSGVKIPTISNPLSGVKIPTIPNPLSGVNVSSSIVDFLNQAVEEEELIPPQEIITEDTYTGGEETQSLLNSSVDIPSNVSSLSYDEISTPTPLSQPVNEQTFYDKLEEPELEPEPEPEPEPEQEQSIDASGEEQANEAINLIQGILTPKEEQTTILQTPKKEPSITQSLQAEEEEEETPLVKKKKTKKALQAEEETPFELKNPDLEEPSLEPLVKTKNTDEKPTIKVSLVQAETKWRELETAGLVRNRTRTPNFEKPSRTAKGKKELLDEIREVDPEWEKQFLK